MPVVSFALNALLRFLRNLFRALFIFFPGFLFLLLTLVCFWNLPQGEDLLVLATEQKGFFLFFEILLAFLVLVSWYSARTVANAKKCSPNTPPGYMADGYYKHVPRFIGFSFFTIILLAFAQTPLYFRQTVPQWVYYALLALSVPYYFLLSDFFERRFKVIRLNRLFIVTMLIIVTGTVVLTIFIGRYAWPVLALMVVMLLILQACFLVLVITRREMMQRNERAGRAMIQPVHPIVLRTAGAAHIPKEEVNFHFGFFLISLVALLIYLGCTFSVDFAVMIGSFPFVLLAFGVLLGAGFLISFFSIRIKLNVHFILVFLAFLFGQWTERHQVDLPERPAGQAVPFTNKASLRDYFFQWVQDRDSLISRSQQFPVYFVLADGGASRSGYWVGSVLGKLEDTSRRAFSQHLFCLSGASGGSVGNAAFYALLHDARSDSSLLRTGQRTFYEAAKEYLRSDFLTFTLSRMLGHDFFVQLLPFNTSADRAKALTEALEKAPIDTVLLRNKLAMPLSELAVFNNNIHTELPILCINTTRMQDGRPAVVSTIDIDPLIFNNRVDVLEKLQEGKDMKLSTAVVLGASFPYVSPAGRIDERRLLRNGTILEMPNYYVDGGYVDNSGAGVVHEMLIKMNYWRDSVIVNGSDPQLKNTMQKLAFYVLHITNGRGGETLLKKVNPFVNDLAAPLKTLMGSYSVQTTINDSRLKNYLQSVYRNDSHYRPINLYRYNDPLTYSMNWVISRRTLDSMDARLHSREVLDYMGTVLKEMNR